MQNRWPLFHLVIRAPKIFAHQGDGKKKAATFSEDHGFYRLFASAFPLFEYFGQLLFSASSEESDDVCGTVVLHRRYQGLFSQKRINGLHAHIVNLVNMNLICFKMVHRDRACSTGVGWYSALSVC